MRARPLATRIQNGNALVSAAITCKVDKLYTEDERWFFSPTC